MQFPKYLYVWQEAGVQWKCATVPPSYAVVQPNQSVACYELRTDGKIKQEVTFVPSPEKVTQ